MVAAAAGTRQRPRLLLRAEHREHRRRELPHRTMEVRARSGLRESTRVRAAGRPAVRCVAWAGSRQCRAPPGPGRRSRLDGHLARVPAPARERPVRPLDVDRDAPRPSPFVDAWGRARLGLVESPDSAGAIAPSGWEHELGGGPECTAVLRSWQDASECGWSQLATLGRGNRRLASADRRDRPGPPGGSRARGVLRGDPRRDRVRGVREALIATTVWLFWWD
jgi:hypothetical protein